MKLSPDEIIFADWGAFKLTATLVYTWVVMAVLLLVSWLATRRLTSDANISRWQNLLEVIVGGIRSQVREMTRHDPMLYLPFVGTLFLFIAVSNTLGIVPGFHPPTGSWLTTAALALCVFAAVPIFGIGQQGLGGYLKTYLKPTPFMVGFNVIGEIMRTVSLAVRLFGNIMSGTMIGAILLVVAAWAIPILMQTLGLITGLIQAYIFAMLAMVYIASATEASQKRHQPAPATTPREGKDSDG